LVTGETPGQGQKSRCHRAQNEEVLTLPEAALFLRVSEGALSELVARHAIPAQRIGEEWRFFKPALADWERRGEEDPPRPENTSL
jgi:excisionase family DNA binding protein